MKKLIGIFSVLFVTQTFALPEASDTLIKAIYKNDQFHEILEANPGFKSVTVNVSYSDRQNPDIIDYCGPLSRSGSVVSVKLIMPTMPRYHSKFFYFSTPFSAEDLSLCVVPMDGE